MKREERDGFIELWRKYFAGAELPIAFYYTDEEGRAAVAPAPTTEHRCDVTFLSRVRKGKPVAFEKECVGCSGSKRYFGFSSESMPGFENFLSCGIPGKIEGERYKKTPGLVEEFLKGLPDFTAPARFLVFKRWDLLEEGEEPEAVIFMAPPDVLSGLFTLANFDEAALEAVIAPFAAGCGSIVRHPVMEGRKERPRAVLGMFDVSARPCVPAGELSFTVPMKKFRSMVTNMEESFLITSSWEKVRSRIKPPREEE